MVKSIPDKHQIERDLETALETLRGKINAGQMQIGGKIVIGEAIRLAILEHDGQQRDEGDPYIIHPIRVATDYLHRWPHSPSQYVVTAVLHDVLEDGEITRNDLQRKFGRVVAVSVKKLTKGKQLPDKEMRKEYLERLQDIQQKLLQVKMVDRLDNLRSCFLNPDREKVARYVRYSRENYLPLAKQAGEKIYVDMEDVIRELTARIED